jgi:hypothetical protein
MKLCTAFRHASLEPSYCVRTRALGEMHDYISRLLVMQASCGRHNSQIRRRHT